MGNKWPHKPLSGIINDVAVTILQNILENIVKAKSKGKFQALDKGAALANRWGDRISLLINRATKLSN